MKTHDIAKTVVLILAGSIGAQAQTFSTNRTPVGMEHNLLFSANHRYTVVQSGAASLNVPMLFDGRFDPSYTSTAPSAANPTVITISGLPNHHIQAGAWVGWSTRYWGARRFKIEGYDAYAGANTWRVVVDHSSQDYTGGHSYTGAMPAGSYTSLRFTFYAGTGTSGELGVSELYFLHPEATAPYQGIVGWTRAGNSVVAESELVGIGTSQPERPLHIRSSNALVRIDRNSSAPGFVVGRYSPDWSTVYKAFQIYVDGSGPDNGEFGIADSHQQMGGGADVRFMINNVGNVGIGTTNPSHKLSVNGTIKAKEVIVETTGWADYVFADDYRLAPLSEVEAHIKAERRLPGIPSEQQVAEGGISVGEMQATLLAKLEELTLHVIALEKVNKEQSTEIEKLRAAIARDQDETN